MPTFIETKAFNLYERAWMYFLDDLPDFYQVSDKIFKKHKMMLWVLLVMLGSYGPSLILSPANKADYPE